jgi:hypothetical protein
MDGYTEFLAIALRWENVAIMLAAWGTTLALGKTLAAFAKSKVGARLQPMAPLLMACVFSMLPGIQPDDMPMSVRFVLGLALGAISGWIYKFYKQSVLGRDSRIKDGTNAHEDQEHPPLPPR